jgi:hypothetical protein
VLEVNGSEVGRSHLFRAELAEAAVVRLGDPADHLVIESWHEVHGYRRRTRK